MQYQVMLYVSISSNKSNNFRLILPVTNALQTIQRWLIARKMKLDIAKADLESHASWREANIPNGRITEEEVDLPDSWI